VSDNHNPQETKKKTPRVGKGTIPEKKRWDISDSGKNSGLEITAQRGGGSIKRVLSFLNRIGPRKKTTSDIYHVRGQLMGGSRNEKDDQDEGKLGVEGIRIQSIE